MIQVGVTSKFTESAFDLILNKILESVKEHLSQDWTLKGLLVTCLHLNIEQLTRTLLLLLSYHLYPPNSPPFITLQLRDKDVVWTK